LEKLNIGKGKLKEEQILEGWQLDKMSMTELKKRIEKIILFSRTTPEQKIKIVETLQELGHTIAMMGDGVNDALALKRADIGVVVGEATEVAKETADMVLLDSNFQTVVASVEEGRGIFENIRKVVLYLLSDSFTEIMLISVSLFIGLPTPILPAQILWVNLVEDGLPGLSLAFEPKDKNLMKEPPREKGEPIINKELKVLIFIIGFVTDTLLLAIFLFLLKNTAMDIAKIRTIIFAALGMDSLLYVFSCKTLRKNLWHEKILSNPYLNGAVLIGFTMLILGIYLPFANKILKTTPLGFLPWILIVGKGTTNIIGIETVKYLFLKKNNH
jgi:Ca2+-transporting ATPase